MCVCANTTVTISINIGYRSDFDSFGHRNFETFGPIMKCDQTEGLRQCREAFGSIV